MSDIFSTAEKMQQEYATKRPPVHLWNPPLSGVLDMRIARDGKWFYLGDEIKRHALAKLFSSILKREGDKYFVVTPVEKWQINIDIAPFYVVRCDVSHSSSTDISSPSQLLTFTTYTDDKFVVDRDHSIWMENRVGEGINNTPEQMPMAMVRDGMSGLISRDVYYQLIDLALAQEEDIGRELFIWSAGEKFSLGKTANN